MSTIGLGQMCSENFVSSHLGYVSRSLPALFACWFGGYVCIYYGMVFQLVFHLTVLMSMCQPAVITDIQPRSNSADVKSQTAGSLGGAPRLSVSVSISLSLLRVPAVARTSLGTTDAVSIPVSFEPLVATDLRVGFI